MVSFVTSEDKAKAPNDVQLNTSKVSEQKQNNIATPSFEITTANLSLEQAEAKAKNMIEAARVLGVDKVTLQISSHEEN